MVKKRFVRTLIIWVVTIFAIAFTARLLLRSYFPQHSFIAELLPILLAGLVCLYVIIKTSQKSLKEIMNLLYDECDPERYLAEYQNYYKLTAKSKLNLKNHFHAINLSLGYILLGRSDDAERLLENTKPNKLNRFAYMINWSAIKIMQDKPDDAENYLTLAQNILLPKRYDLLQARLALEFNQALVHYLRKEYDISTRMITELKPEFTVKLTQLSAMYNLGLIAKETGDIQLARDYFSQVAEQGNTLFIAVKAKAFLDELN